jgi:hypothetical protein
MGIRGFNFIMKLMGRGNKRGCSAKRPPEAVRGESEEGQSSVRAVSEQRQSSVRAESEERQSRVRAESGEPLTVSALFNFIIKLKGLLS